MNKRSGSSWWSSIGFGVRAETHAPDTDFADMGTAFGLDASMDTLPMPVEGSAAKKDNGRPPAEGAGRRTKR